ncbi:Hercynine oxygenase [Candidatus Entotheonellaceae bacterium PAL068K]
MGSREEAQSFLDDLNNDLTQLVFHYTYTFRGVSDENGGDSIHLTRHARSINMPDENMPDEEWPPTLRDRWGIEFVRLLAGVFMMGSQNGDQDEQPVHRVWISQPFYLGKYEVTQGQWEQVMWGNPSRFTGNPNRPVEEVSWHDVQVFIERLNAIEGSEIYRLPTEAMPDEEWPPTLRDRWGIEFVRIPAGVFMMGSQNGDQDEQPVHRVWISQPFYLGKYEVTQGQWEQVMWGNPSRFTGNPNRPVEEVSWHDVQVFIERLNAREGREIYRLPTEAEWEYAARAGTTTDYHFGNDRSQLEKYAWYDGTSGYETHPVGQLQPNAWGLHDMHGNVREWVQDWYDASYYEQSPARDPRGPSGGSNRVDRGGSWFNRPAYVRSAIRYRAHPAHRYASLGFRLLRISP